MVEPLISSIKKSRFYQEIAEEVAQESKLKRNREIAQAMIKKNMSIELIAELTSLSQEEVLEISKELADRKN